MAGPITQGIQLGVGIHDRLERLGLEKQQAGLQQQKFQLEQEQEQAKQAKAQFKQDQDFIKGLPATGLNKEVQKKLALPFVKRIIKVTGIPGLDADSLTIDDFTEDTIGVLAKAIESIGNVQGIAEKGDALEVLTPVIQAAFAQAETPGEVESVKFAERQLKQRLAEQKPTGGLVAKPRPNLFEPDSLQKFSESGDFSDLVRIDKTGAGEVGGLTPAQRATADNAKRDDATRVINRQFGEQTVTGGFVIDEDKFVQFQQALVFMDDFIEKNSAETAGVLSAVKATLGEETFDNILGLIAGYRKRGESDKKISSAIKKEFKQRDIDTKNITFLIRAK